jgi:hypothetical protein
MSCSRNPYRGKPLCRKNRICLEWNEAQWAHRKRFSLASDYAKAALAEPTVREAYQKRAKRLHKRPRDLAISDYFKGKDLLAKKGGKPKKMKGD